MTTYYCDTSALVKRYTEEPGSGWIRHITDSSTQHTVLISEITVAEVAAVLAAKHRAPKGITSDERDQLLSRFLEDCTEHFVLLQVDRAVIDRAVELTQRHRLRGYDAVQLATALVTQNTLLAQNLPALTFVASDGDLLAAASNEAPAVENPLDHVDMDATAPSRSNT